MTDTDDATKEAKDKVSNKAPLRTDTALLQSEGKRHPGRLELSSTKNHFISAPLPSALNVNACCQAGQVPVRRCVFILFVCEQI